MVAGHELTHGFDINGTFIDSFVDVDVFVALPSLTTKIL